MKNEMIAFGSIACEWNSPINYITLASSKFHLLLMKLKLNPSWIGLLFPLQLGITCFISSIEKRAINIEISSFDNLEKLIPSNTILLSCSSRKFYLKYRWISYLISSTPWTQSSSRAQFVLDFCNNILSFTLNCFQNLELQVHVDLLIQPLLHPKHHLPTNIVISTTTLLMFRSTWKRKTKERVVWIVLKKILLLFFFKLYKRLKNL